MEPLVNFIICGAQKSGTTALDCYLRENPQVCMAKRKEVHFFDNEKNYVEPETDYNVYESAFEPTDATRAVGEATPIYMYWQPAIERIWRYNPKIKLIVILRNPIERAFSHWNMERARNAEVLGFGEAIRFERERCRESMPQQHRVYSYLDRGFYSEQIRRIWRFFPSEQVIILRYEDLRNHPESTLSCICDFIGVDYFGPVKQNEVQQWCYETQLQVSDKTYLKKMFTGEIKTLEHMLGWDLSDWLEV